MAEVNSGITTGQMAQAIADAVMALPQYVNQGQFQTVSDLLANFPASATVLGKLGRVSDLWGSIRTTMICEQDASGYYWRPQRTDYAPAPITQTSGAMSLIPLVTAPIIRLTGTLAGNVTVTPQVTNVWPGATFTISTNSVLGLFGISLAGLLGGGTIPLLAGGKQQITYYSGSGWAAS